MSGDPFSTPPTPEELGRPSAGRTAPAAAQPAPATAPSPTPASVQPSMGDPFAAPPAKAELDVAPPVVQEKQHPGVSDEERLAIQWFGTKPEQVAAYLRAKHPDLDVRLYDDPGAVATPEPGAGPAAVGADMMGGQSPAELQAAATNATNRTTPGRVLIRSKDAKPQDPWMPVVPKGFEEKGEYAKTLAAAAVGVPAAALQYGGAVAGGAAGGALGAFLGGPPAAYLAPAGAVAGGAAGSAGAEALRQAAGRFMGINTEMDPRAIGSAAVGGGAGTLLGGFGRGVPGSVSTNVPLGPTLFSMGEDATAPTITGAVSGAGIPARAASKSMELLKGLEPGKLTAAAETLGKIAGGAKGLALGVTHGGVTGGLETMGGAFAGGKAGKTAGAAAEKMINAYSPDGLIARILGIAAGPVAAGATQAYSPWRKPPAGSP